MQYPKTFKQLIDQFSKLPSIGPKAAERIVLYLFKQDRGTLEDFAQALEGLNGLQTCERCFHIAEDNLCVICQDQTRDTATLCVVEEPLDVIAFERSEAYHGLYHVLGGVIEGGNEAGQQLRIPELLRRVQTEGIEEVILAMNPTTEGDLTALYLKKKLEPSGVKVTRLARGLATGGDIEYADTTSLRSSLEHRESL